MPRSRRDLPDPTRTAVAAPESPRAVAAPGTGRRLRLAIDPESSYSRFDPVDLLWLG